MWIFRDSIKEEVEFPEVLKKKTHVKFPWVLIFDHEIPMGATQFLQNFQG